MTFTLVVLILAALMVSLGGLYVAATRNVTDMGLLREERARGYYAAQGAVELVRARLERGGLEALKDLPELSLGGEGPGEVVGVTATVEVLAQKAEKDTGRTLVTLEATGRVQDSADPRAAGVALTVTLAVATGADGHRVELIELVPRAGGGER